MSVSSRILGPILLLLLIGLACATWITQEAVRTYNRIEAEEQLAYDLLESVKRAEHSLDALQNFIAAVLRFDTVIPPSAIETRYRHLEDDLAEQVAILRAIGGSVADMSAAEDFQTAANAWTTEAEIALGLTQDMLVPSVVRMSHLAARVETALTNMSFSARAAADARLAAMRHSFAERVETAFLTMIGLFAIFGLLFLGLGRNLASSLRGLSAAMETVRLGKFATRIDGDRRRDEIGEIARGVLAFGQTLEALTTAKLRIEHLALHDQLTGLPNRRALQDRLSTLLLRASEELKTIVVLHVDLDRFKQINDLLGHAAGDQILRHAAEAMKVKVGRDNLAARIGGDEFVIVLSDVSSDETAAKVAKEVINAVSQPLEILGELVSVGASIGIANSSCESSDGERLLGNADMALYIAKAAGRGRYAFYSESTRAQFESDMSVLRDLRAGLERSEIGAFFQPQLDTTTDEVIGFEALARWKHPSQGLLGPNSFIDIAFSNGLGDRITGAIVRSAIDALLHWRARGLHAPCVSVNFSAGQLRDGGLVEDLDDLLLEAGLEPRDLVIEVLESVLLGDAADPALTTIAHLKRRGYRVELDDFGTGHASVSNLCKFKVDGVKLDRVFVSGIDNDPEQQVIARTLIELCQNLTISCLAEGVETAPEMTCLQTMGCTRFQGYRIAEPMPRDDVTRWLTSQDTSNRVLKKSGLDPVCGT